MPIGDTDIGTGTTLTFAGFVMELMTVSWSGIERVSVSTSHMGSAGPGSYLPGEVWDPGEITAEVNFDSTVDIGAPMAATATTLTITFPANTTTATWTANAFMTGFEFNDPFEDKMTGTATFKATGEIGFN